MIVDAIIAFFGSIFGFLAEGVAMVFIPLVNLLAAGIEAIIGVFISGFKLGRIERKKREPRSMCSTSIHLLPLLLVLGVIGWFMIVPKMMNREVTFLADDGHALPFVALVIHTNGGDKYKRADNAGSIVISRFGTNAITVKDPRYLEKTWKKSEIESELVVGRTILGSGLDSLADRLLKPAIKRQEKPAQSTDSN